MKYLVSVVFIAVFFSGCITQERVEPSIRSGIIRVYATKYKQCSMGTGVLVRYKNRDIVITAAHVLQGMDGLLFYSADKNKLSLDIDTVMILPVDDVSLILLKSSPVGLTPLPVSKEFAPGDRVEAIGYWEGGSLHISCGEIEVLPFFGGSLKILASVVVSPGMSGSPLFCNGKVVGITLSSFTRQGQRRSFYAPISKVLELLDEKK